MTRTISEQPFGHTAEAIPRVSIAEEEGRPIYLWSTDSPLQSMTGDLVTTMVREAEEVLERLT